MGGVPYKSLRLLDGSPPFLILKKMVRVAEIQEKLFHLIGWEQNFDTTEFQISPALTQSETGLYFQQVHPLLTLQNLSSVAPDFKNIIYQDYSYDKEYFEGNIVNYNGFSYKALKKSVGMNPSTDYEYWVLTNPFSEWLEGKTKASIQKAIMRYYSENVIKGTYKSLCENKTLFEGAGRIVDTIKNKNNCVGFEIVPIRSKGVTTRINKIGLQFTEPGLYKIYLMHSSMDVPVRIIELNKLRKNSIEWFSFQDLYLPYQSADNDAGGSWYICYFQSELPAGSYAIQKNKDWSKEPCGSCSRQELISWKAWSKYLEVHPFYISEEHIEGKKNGSGDYNDDFNDDFNNDFEGASFKMWDIEKNNYKYDTNFGLNLEVTVACDITDFIIEQRLLFQDVIGKQVAIDMLREFAYNANVRTNRHSINASRPDILYEIDGDSASMKNSGLAYQLDMAIKATSLSIKGIDRVCMPCENYGVKHKSVL